MEFLLLDISIRGKVQENRHTSDEKQSSKGTVMRVPNAFSRITAFPISCPMDGGGLRCSASISFIFTFIDVTPSLVSSAHEVAIALIFQAQPSA